MTSMVTGQGWNTSSVTRRFLEWIFHKMNGFAQYRESQKFLIGGAEAPPSSFHLLHQIRHTAGEAAAVKLVLGTVHEGTELAEG